LKKALICSINEKYIDNILKKKDIDCLIGRKGLDYLKLSDYKALKIIKYNKKNYVFSSLLNSVCVFSRFSELIIPCYDIANIPDTYFNIILFGLFKTKKLVFIDINNREFIIDKILDYIAFKVFRKKLRLIKNDK